MNKKKLSDNLKILIVDDHEVLRDGLKLLIRKRIKKSDISESGSGEDAILKNFEIKPDIIILDISLPDMAGYEIIGRLKKDNTAVKIIILTMYDNEKYIIDAYKKGAQAYLLKENASNNIIKAIENVFKNGVFYAPSHPEDIIERISSNKNTDSVLTNREIEVLKYVADGKTNKEISKILILSVRTVEVHRKNFMNKLKLKTSAELVIYALKNGYRKI